MEETILIGDDLMMGPPSPLIPPKIASHVLEGVDLCDGILRNLFLCKFCLFPSLLLLFLFSRALSFEDKELREQLQDSEHKLGSSMPLDEANERATQLQSEVTSLDRYLVFISKHEMI
ncbi:hypothetical protein HYC85_031993 [Camellia sinensis]|uniref:DUF7803 domain-containing protein n=1 Tax=Camellia sinensis TaxID=4442 RepID=A0A7J7FRZ0_CAMSI|nr:hypothetical protein HYC85_031993 [Camellia sinensis]